MEFIYVAGIITSLTCVGLLIDSMLKKYPRLKEKWEISTTKDKVIKIEKDYYVLSRISADSYREAFVKEGYEMIFGNSNFIKDVLYIRQLNYDSHGGYRYFKATPLKSHFKGSI